MELRTWLLSSPVASDSLSHVLPVTRTSGVSCHLTQPTNQTEVDEQRPSRTPIPRHTQTRVKDCEKVQKGPRNVERNYVEAQVRSAQLFDAICADSKIVSFGTGAICFIGYTLDRCRSILLRLL